MNLEQLIDYAIYVHAFFGGLGLITGIGSMIVKKGSPLHKKMGKVFSISMVTNSLISIPVACMPNHKSAFLFLIGVFTIYLVLSGNRSLSFKPRKKKKAALVDVLISGGMFLSSLVMIGIGIYSYSNSGNGILFLLFGGGGLSLTIGDYFFFKRYPGEETKIKWLLNHISRMMGALIASITAFLIVGLSTNSLFAWILPSVIGTIYIIYWQKKMKAKMVK